MGLIFKANFIRTFYFKILCSYNCIIVDVQNIIYLFKDISLQIKSQYLQSNIVNYCHTCHLKSFKLKYKHKLISFN